MKRIIYCDMDGVVCCFKTGVTSLEPNMIWDDKNVNRVCEANPRVFRTLPCIEGAKEALNTLKDKYDIYFASTSMWNVPESFMDKRIWLQENYPWAEKKFILTHNKGLLNGDFLIDDTKNNGVLGFKGLFLHFGSERFPDWNSILNFLL